MRKQRLWVAFVLLVAMTAAPGFAADVRFIRADTNADGAIDLSDAVFGLMVLFSGGAQAGCADALDANDDGEHDIADAVYTLQFLFARGSPPTAPYPMTGCDPTPDQRGCASYRDNAPCETGGSIIADHRSTSIAGLSPDLVGRAKGGFRIWYGHTSHGSQIMSGLSAMLDELYDFNRGAGTLSIVEVGGDLGNPSYTEWANTTRAKLAAADNDRNVVMWSWCGQASSATEEIIRLDYLGNMAALESDFPAVRFIYMTGHLDGSGVDGNLNQRNEQIRAFCRANGKILFDFADIESYDPDGAYYVDRGATDNCDYRDGGTTRNWASEWCARNPGACSSCSCAHSQSLNCDRKARAFWRLLARMAETLEP